MEIEKERNIHYLHPDFEEENENNEKKPSPLALLAQTCQSIGSNKDCKNMINRDKSCSPNSTSTATRKSFKRSNSDYLSNSSNSPSLDRTCSPPSKKTKPSIDLDYQNNRVELTHADTSSDLGKEINQSLMNNFTNFLKNSNNSQQSYTDKLEFLYFLTNRFMNQESNSITEKTKDISHFNISSGYHLKDQAKEFNKQSVDHKQTISTTNPLKNTEPISYDKLNSLSESTTNSGSTIKYCMYCGKLIPLLPMLLAHIRIDHANDQISGLRLHNFNTQMPSLCDFLTKFNPYNLSTQASPSPSISNYIYNWSSLLGGYENMIF